MCLAMCTDVDGSKLWYRAQFHSVLANGKAQVGLIDFHVLSVVDLLDIRKFDPCFAYERMSFVAKIRSNDDISLDLLDTNRLQNYAQIEAVSLKILNEESYEVYLSDQYFLFEDDLIMVD